MKVVINIVALSLFSQLWGCATHDPAPGDPRYAPVFPVTPVPAPQSQGSIFAAGGGVSLWEDQRARRVGDILTIMLEERTTSKKSSSTETSKKDENTMSVTSLLGTTPSTNVPFLGSSSDLTLDSQTSNERDFEGDAGADQSNQLSGSISVTVVNVLPSGVLMVRGEKWMTLTRGSEFIRIEGLIRPSDIGPDNTVESTRIADARITYSETGELSDANKKGWLSRFFSSPAWPF
ncbi:MAG: flagellar basal body L-ring protein FlgH [Pseudomonadales bacterium]|nr:flagellar basal body L-ring protein FlgH [Pseudomonadales bacterium]